MTIIASKNLNLIAGLSLVITACIPRGENLSQIAADGPQKIHAHLFAGANAQLQLMFSTPTTATKAWMCLGATSPRSCSATNAGAQPLNLAVSATEKTHAYFHNPNPVSPAVDLTFTVVATDKGGTNVASQTYKFQTPKPGLSTDLTPPLNSPMPRPIAGQDIMYDYPGTFSRVSPTAIIVRLWVQQGTLKSRRQLQFSGTLVSLRNSTYTAPITATVNVDANGIIDFPITNLTPETPYRIDKILISDSGDAISKVSLKFPYYGVTGGSTALATARKKITAQAFAEGYDWNFKNYDRRKGYIDNAPGGWCDQFWVWGVHEALKVRWPQDYGPNYMERNKTWLRGTDLQAVMNQEPIHGDLLYSTDEGNTHSFMALSYDVATSKLYSIEGNFNNQVMHNVRKVSPRWRWGHLNPSMVR